MRDDSTEDERTEAVGVLIRRCAYREALSLTVELLGGELGQFCMAVLGDQDEATAALEALLVELHDAMPGLEERPLRPYLYGRALAICTERLDARSEEERRRALSLTPPDSRRLPKSAEEAQRNARRMRVALSGLKPAERDAVLLRYAAGLDYAAIASLCETDAATVKKRIGKALLGVRKALQEEAA